MKKKRTYNLSKKRNIRNVILSRYNILSILIVLLFLILLFRLYIVQIIDTKKYNEYVKLQTSKIIEGDTAPRGRIYDRFNNLIVDNKVVKNITYKYVNGIKTSDEVNMAYKLVDLIDINHSNLYLTNLKEFYMILYKDEVDNKITNEERKLLKERKISEDDIYKYKIDRITSEDLSKLNDRDRKAAYVYYLMNKGYYYDTKTIKSDVTDLEYAKVGEYLDELKGFDTKLDWERYYPYGNTFKTILGSISNSLPSENASDYLDMGYSLNDRVGISFIEKQYESILKGSKNKYIVNSNGSYSLYEEGTRGNDIVLTIDINLQREVEKILKEQVVQGMKELPFGFYNRSFVIIQEPSTGEVLAMSGIQAVYKNGSYSTYDVTDMILTNPVTVGSAIKGASHIVGYNNNALKIGEVRNDYCFKIASTPLKCSWSLNLGNLTDITALKQSSNSYQYQTAIKIANATYSYNKPLVIDTKAFDINRSTFKEFGLGTYTGIDLPLESIGYIGNKTDSGLLLDLSIGLYDNYTPIQLSQYVGTIANSGVRVKPHLLKEVYSSFDNSLLYKIDTLVLNKVNTKDEYMERVQKGFKAVFEMGGTGYGYIDSNNNPAGKTGTADSFIDTDNDGLVDRMTVTNTFVAYAPYDNPTVTFTIVSPDIGYYSNNILHRNYINKKIAQLVSKKYFEIYK